MHTLQRSSRTKTSPIQPAKIDTKYHRRKEESQTLKKTKQTNKILVEVEAIVALKRLITYEVKIMQCIKRTKNTEIIRIRIKKSARQITRQCKNINNQLPNKIGSTNIRTTKSSPTFTITASRAMRSLAVAIANLARGKCEYIVCSTAFSMKTTAKIV